MTAILEQDRREELLNYLEKVANDNQASDLFIVPYAPVYKKEGRELVSLGEMRTDEDTYALVEMIYKLSDRENHFQDFLHNGDDDFSFSVKGADRDRVPARFRVNTYRQRGSLAAVMRVVPYGIPDWQAMRIPPQVMELAGLTSDMVLITGPAGSGKSTTQACIINQISRNRSSHIITLEDPIEYLHRNDRDAKSIVSQREVGIDTEDYLAALRACLRQAPDVILLGEMRDQETIRTAMTAAETGHLLIATLHTKGAVNTVDRIVDSFPSGQQEQVRAQLCMVLHTVVSQQLLPSVNGGMVPAFEIMHVNSSPSISNLIREKKNNQVNNAIATGGKDGMISMDQSILALYRAGEITRDTALQYCDNREQMSRLLGT